MSSRTRSSWAALSLAVALAMPTMAIATPETTVTGNADVLFATGADATPVTFDIQGRLDLVWTLDSGLQPGVSLGGRMLYDRASRDGQVSPGPGCALEACLPALSPINGTGFGDDPSDGAAAAMLDRAAIFLRGGWGEITLGRSDGAADRSVPMAPSLMTLADSAGSGPDPFGLGAVVGAGLSASAAKLSMSSVRLVGVRASLSYAPKTDQGSLDGPPDEAALGGTLEDVLEAGIDGTVRLGGTEWTLALSHATAKLTPLAGAAGATDITLTSLYGGGERGDWRFGVGLRSGDQGPVFGPYRAAEASVIVDRGAWHFQLSGNLVSESRLGARTQGVHLAGGYAISESVLATIGVTSEQRRQSGTTIPGVTEVAERRSGVVAGLSIAY
jgi:hypothetical protein